MIYNIKLQRVKTKDDDGGEQRRYPTGGQRQILSTGRELASQSNVSFPELKKGEKENSYMMIFLSLVKLEE